MEANWISVTESLPSFNEQVLTFGLRKGMNPQMGGSIVCIANRVDIKGTPLAKDRDKYVDEYDFAMMDYVTHWMPLPAPPQLKSETLKGE